VSAFKTITHISTALLLGALFNIPNSAQLACLIILGSILPNAENLIIYCAEMFNAPKLLSYKMAAHSITGITVLAAASFLLLPFRIACSIIFGYSVHVIFDLLSMEGCTLLYPFDKRPRSLAHIKMKGVEEYLLDAAFLYIFISKST
jgi:membrane-bound metal-dependent hydrolase YbcI (DUF457 family)